MENEKELAYETLYNLVGDCNNPQFLSYLNNRGLSRNEGKIIVEQIKQKINECKLNRNQIKKELINLINKTSKSGVILTKEQNQNNKPSKPVKPQPPKADTKVRRFITKSKDWKK